jgi:hypothetical protein
MMTINEVAEALPRAIEQARVKREIQRRRGKSVVVAADMASGPDECVRYSACVRDGVISDVWFDEERFQLRASPEMGAAPPLQSNPKAKQ